MLDGLLGSAGFPPDDRRDLKVHPQDLEGVLDLVRFIDLELIAGQDTFLKLRRLIHYFAEQFNIPNMIRSHSTLLVRHKALVEIHTFALCGLLYPPD